MRLLGAWIWRKSSPMLQSALERALCARKKVIGERKRRSQSVGMSLTSTQKAVKISRITRRFSRNRMPEKFRPPRLARLAKSDWKKLRKAATSPAAPMAGNCVVRRDGSYEQGDLGLLRRVDEVDHRQRLVLFANAVVRAFIVALLVPDLDVSEVVYERGVSAVVSNVDRELVVSVEVHGDVLVGAERDLIQTTVLVELAVAGHSHVLGS